jgi:very-short-patch-repair endonuclease/uncharacterized Zn ribbon protein
MSKNNYQGSLKHKENARNAFLIARDVLSLKKQNRIKEYDQHPKQCKECNKVFSYEQRGKTFCNSSCAASFNNSKRKLSEETRKKISKSLNGKGTLEPYTKICIWCKKEFITYKKNQIGCCRSCSAKHIQSKPETKQKISLAQKKLIAEGKFVGWKSRKDKEPSYPEKYFISLFENEHIIGWERDHKIGRWFIDFAFINKKLALEIDGKQHEERKEQDKIKDDFLINNGWKVFRVKWYNPINENNKEKIYKEIEEFKAILNDKL